jgi:pentatricopeptide repeat protein
MPPRPFVNDALWRCLCPRFPANAPSVVARTSSTRAPPLRTRPRKGSTAQQLRAYNHASAASPYNEPFFSREKAPSFDPNNTERVRPPRNVKDKIPLAQLPTSILYEHLRDAGAKGNFNEVMNICRVLVKDRGDPPNKEMYNGILHSFVSANNGTAGKVRKVLNEMGFWTDGNRGSGDQFKIDLDARGCECVLEVLAVHPDYILRTEILDYMKSRWFTLSERGQNFVVAGMLRERNFEQALETMEEMQSKNTRIESWLLDKAMWMLLEFGEVEEAFYVLSLKHAVQRQGNATGSPRISHALWGALLDAAAHRQLVSQANSTLLYVKSNTTTV